MTDIDWAAPVPKDYWRDARGNLVHATNVRPIDRDMDATVRKIHGFGVPLSAQLWRFRAHSLDDIYAFIERVRESYGAKVGGRKGNVRLVTFDGLRKVELAQAEYISVGPEITAAQALFMECIDEWSARAAINLRTLVTQAFSVDGAGKLSVSALLKLRRIHIDDPRWVAAQNALADALRPSGRVEYIRLYERSTPLEDWRPVVLHLASVTAPPAGEESREAVLERRVRSAVEEARHAGMSEGAIMEVLREAKRRAPKRDESAGGEEAAA